ncbi:MULTISPECIES: DUF2231 domain-containing protein [Methylomonas]|uniref:DUF2231 domain-containing protein n=2 Tax=Methylomonas TaxID=416 RepID=A0A140E650_9GAMM|nr:MULTISPECIES: DUF2231 domain-containing protein [Methylomonas]AMK78874.1 hypothetical protein JT25_020700 [Methylomonas denitrificans]OAI02146.1 hypothetical protein A1342_02630 [Methylomonas methanica]TCV78262.1 putative membrane protein [Methylomonas methanica]
MLGLNDHLSFAVHGGGDNGGGVAGGVESILSFLETLVQKSPSESFSSVLPGIAALQNIHPLLVHFPIALLTLFFTLDVIGSLAKRSEWRQIAGAFLYLGTVFAALTVAAGLAAAATVAHGGNVHDIMEHHEHLGISVLSLASILSAWRLLSKGHIVGPANSLYLLLAAILSALLAFTADLGGLMVYRYGVSVHAADQVNQAAAQAHEHEGAAEDGLPAVHEEAEVDDLKQDDSHHDETAHGAAGHHHAH